MREGYRVLFINSHVVYYTVTPSAIHIIRVLHSRMDPQRHLARYVVEVVEGLDLSEGQSLSRLGVGLVSPGDAAGTADLRVRQNTSASLWVFFYAALPAGR